MKEQEEIFSQYGVHYSEFYHLEYWYPTHQIVVNIMHNGLEGNAEDHFHHILSLMKESAKIKPVPPPAFDHKFTRIKVDDPPFPNDMSEKEAKQVGHICALLIAPLAGVDNTGAIVDHMVFYGSVTLLGCHLDSKNMKVLKFISSDIKLIPLKPKVLMDQAPRYYKKDWIQCLLEWVSISGTCIYLC